MDDDYSIAHIVGEVVASFGHEVTTATDPFQALQIAENFDVVVSDFSMPHMHGVDLLKAVRISNPDALRILLTALPDVDEIVEAVADGTVHQVISKPPTMAEIQEAIDHEIE